MEIRISPHFCIKAGPGSRQQAMELAGLFLVEQQRTKRLCLGAVCIFLVLAALLMVFAPEHREHMAKAWSVAFIVLAIGTGVTSFKMKLWGIEIDTTDNGEGLHS